MCGIVGHIGLSNSVNVVLEGLKRLEYRGYDSAGICFKDKENELALYKKKGKLENLRELLTQVDTSSHSCIGHTRWATHGEVNDVNSHPHLSDTMFLNHGNSIAIVHNGIIENSVELKKELTSKGIKFITETDSEVFLGLLVSELESGKDLYKAISSSFKRVRGNSAFVIEAKDKNEIIAIKKGAPLVCGVNAPTLESFVSSDPYALAGMVSKIYFPEDEVMCILTPDEKSLITFFELDGTPSNRVMVKENDLPVTVAEKGEYEHFMLKEIFEQPSLIRSFAHYYTTGAGNADLKKALRYSPKRIHISACGTAWHAGLVIRGFFEKINKIPCNVELASEFRYRDPLLSSDELGLFISQSGETADTLAAQALCKKNSLETLSIVNVEGSTLYRECSDNFLIRAGVEIGVASTKAFTLQVLTGRLLSCALNGSLDDEQRMSKLTLLADRVEELLANNELIKDIAEKIYNYKGFIFTGRGKDYPVALEGALKLKEIAYVHAEGYAAGELKHGPIALIDDQMVNVAIVGPDLYEKTVSNLQEVKARRGIIVTIGPKNDESLEKMSDYYIGVDYTDLEELSPVYVNVAMQLLAYYMAKFKGTDIDKPRNLAKSVTVE
jgi:glucosamine--fructose-6-phosphate aminotransferase (isomerizing)